MSITYAPPVDIVARPIVAKERRRGPALTRERRLEIAAERRVKTAQIEEELGKWYEASIALSEDLSRRFPSKKPEAYLYQMLSGALKSGKTREPNAYNAWIHSLAKDGSNVKELDAENIEEYHKLSAKEKAALKAELAEERNSRQFGARISQRGRTQDVNHVCEKIEELLQGLQHRVGIEAFMCVVRNTPDYPLKPRWWFTSNALDEFLRGNVRKFEPERIGVMAEAFAIAGCDYFNQLKNTEQKAAFLKSEIRDMVVEALVLATGDPGSTMSYVNFTRDIELAHGVTIDGWTHHQFCTPSKMSSTLGPLKTLYDALKNKTCKFVRLSPSQRSNIQKRYEEEQAAGAKVRKPRCDAGKKRKSKDAASAGTSKKARVDNDDDANESDGGGSSNDV
ncbi:hypothetical protein C2E23DRAFT_859032 [Lenzites betulinus]|nr:hypothetical protein C2E23DRAFT_859032 [Lenzites betulinus]